MEATLELFQKIPTQHEQTTKIVMADSFIECNILSNDRFRTLPYIVAQEKHDRALFPNHYISPSIVIWQRVFFAGTW